MGPILKKRPREVSCQSPVKFLAKCCNLKGGGHREKRRGVGPAGLKTPVLNKAPPHPSDASPSNADSPGHLSPAHSQGPPETPAKYTGKQKRGAKLRQAQRAEERRKRQVTFSLTSLDLGE